MKSIATVLSTSIECKVLRTAQDVVLQVGGLISAQDCTRIIESCAEILHKLEGFRRNCHFHLSTFFGYLVILYYVKADNFVYGSQSL